MAEASAAGPPSAPETDGSPPAPIASLATPLNLWVITGCCVISTVGLSGDIGRHLRSGTSITGDFWASWHLVLYAGVTGLAGWLGRLALVHGPKPMRATFGPTVVGVFVLGAGGMGDWAWHSAFGIEVDIPALLSPPHLLLLLGLVLVVLGPVAALWRSPATTLSWSDTGVLSLCTMCAIVIVSLFTGYLSVFSSDVVVNGYANPMVGTRLISTEVIHGVATLLWSSLVLTVPWLVLRLRWRLRPGLIAVTFAVLAGASATAVQGVASEIVTAALVGGVVIDVALTVVTRGWGTDRSLLATAVAVPTVLWTFMFVALVNSGRLVWGATLWVGSIELCTFLTLSVGGVLVLARRAARH